MKTLNQPLSKRPQASDINRCCIVSIVSQKGGVGKTTSTVNLAAYLSQMGLRVLLVDFDPQANATSGIGMNQHELECSVYHVLMDASFSEKALCPTPFERLHVLPSSKALAGAEVELVSHVSRENVLKSRLERFKPFYDFILIDCPPSLGLLTINALVASDQAIIPVQCEYFALEGIAGLIDTLNKIKESINPRLEIGGIVLTMFDSRTSFNRQVVENTKHFFTDLVFDTIIPRNIRLSEAPSHGIPISLYNPSSKGAVAYQKLAKEVYDRVYTNQ